MSAHATPAASRPPTGRKEQRPGTRPPGPQTGQRSIRGGDRRRGASGRHSIPGSQPYPSERTAERAGRHRHRPDHPAAHSAGRRTEQSAPSPSTQAPGPPPADAPRGHADPAGRQLSPVVGCHSPPFTLLLAVDDATGSVVNALFCEQEDSRNYFLLMQNLRGPCQQDPEPLWAYAHIHSEGPVEGDPAGPAEGAVPAGHRQGTRDRTRYRAQVRPRRTTTHRKAQRPGTRQAESPTQIRNRGQLTDRTFSLFIYTDRIAGQQHSFGPQIFIRSAGLQTVLDYRRGTLPKPRPEPDSKRKPGVEIQVPYRTASDGNLVPFGLEEEKTAFDQFAQSLIPTLIKLVVPDSPKQLKRLEVKSERHDQRITWTQSAKKIDCSTRYVTGIERTLKVVRSRLDRSHRAQETIREVEFQRSFEIPEEFGLVTFPSYFRASNRSRIKIGVSVRMKGSQIDLSPNPPKR